MYYSNSLCKPRSDHGDLFSGLSMFKLTVLVIAIIIMAANPLKAHAASDTVTRQVTHKHAGSSNVSGGCYTTPVYHVHTDSCYETYTNCHWTFSHTNGYWDWIHDYELVFTTDCGETHTQMGAIGDECTCQDHGTHTELTCQDTYTVTGYTTACGLDEDSILGSFSVVADTEDWSKSVTFTMSVTGDIADGSIPFKVNGTAQASDTYTATSNGSYSFSINAANGANEADSLITYNISNIDTTAPSINYRLEPEDWTAEGVTLTITDIRDVQPDGTEGCGVAALPYSFDNGRSWSESASHIYTENGSFRVLTRDKLGNVSAVTVTIDTIDREAPNITSISYDHEANAANAYVAITADDIRADGSEGCGLALQAYSFDGGLNYISESGMLISSNGPLTLCVRDALGNTAQKTIEITGLDVYGPTVRYIISSIPDITVRVGITLSATDTGFNGGDGIGLPKDCYSYDEGATWTDNNYITADENSLVTVWVRDSNNNISIVKIPVGENEKTPVIISDGDDGDNDDDDEETPTEDTPVTPVVTPGATPTADNDSTPSYTPKKSGTSLNKPTAAAPTPTPVAVSAPKALSNGEETVVVRLDTPTDTESESPGLMHKILLAALISAAVLLLAGLILFVLSRLVWIYSRKSEKSYRLMGICLLHRTKESHEIRLSQSILDASDTPSLLLSLPVIFSALHKGEDAVVYLPDKYSYVINIDRKVKLNLKKHN